MTPERIDQDPRNEREGERDGRPSGDRRDVVDKPADDRVEQEGQQPPDEEHHGDETEGWPHVAHQRDGQQGQHHGRQVDDRRQRASLPRTQAKAGGRLGLRGPRPARRHPLALRSGASIRAPSAAVLRRVERSPWVAGLGRRSDVIDHRGHGSTQAIAGTTPSVGIWWHGVVIDRSARVPYARLIHEGPRDGDPLLLAAREFRRAVLSPVGDAHEVEGLERRLAGPLVTRAGGPIRCQAYPRDLEVPRQRTDVRSLGMAAGRPARSG